MEFVTTVGGQSYFQYAWTEISGIRGLFSVCAYTITVPDPNFFPGPYTNSNHISNPNPNLYGIVSGLFVPQHFHSREREVHSENFRYRGTFSPWNLVPGEEFQEVSLNRTFTPTELSRYLHKNGKQCKQCNQDKQWALAVSHGRNAVYYRYAATCRDGVHDHHN